MQTTPSAQNTDDNVSQKHMAEPNVSLYRTPSLAGCASAPELSVTAAHSLCSSSGRVIFWVRKLWPRSRGYLMLLKPDSVITWIILVTVKWIALCVKCGQCLCWRLIILLSQCHCQFGKVHEALCWWSTKRTFFCGRHSWVVWCCFADRRWQQSCRNQNSLALLLMTSDITRYRTWYSVSGCT